MSLIGPAGTPTAVKVSYQSSAFFSRSRCSNTRTNSPR
ncbi:Uncharacterised protein [Mycobacteroides abscessus subsp. abscessus]|nr:Uncharacterised protein [Mycobacteroides abscessus subsp. abscessus]